MSKYEVEVGGFVTVLRQRKLIVHAIDEETAKEKAIDKFCKIQTAAGGCCDNGIVDSVIKID